MPEPINSTIAPSQQTRPRGLWLLLAVVAVIHAPGLFAPFIIDDYVYISQAHDLDWAGAAATFTGATLDDTASSVWWVPSGTLPFYRPMGQLSFALDYQIWGLRPIGFHLTNLLLHLVCTVLTWRLAGKLLSAPGDALAVAIVFALHPIHSEAVTWISGRFDLLVCACVLASTLCYLNWQRDAAAGWHWCALSVFWFAAGLVCKETALILPGVLLGVELLNGTGRPRNARHLLTAAVAFGLVASLYVAGRFALFGALTGKLPPPYGLDTSSPLIALKCLAWNLGQYLLDFILFIQVEPAFFAEFLQDYPIVLGTILTVASLIALAAIVIAWRSQVFQIGLLWTALFTAPCLLAMPGERNVYLASVGFAVAVVGTFKALSARVAARSGSSDRPATVPWLRRLAQAVVVLWLVLSIVEQGLAWSVAATGEKVFRDLEALLPDPPPDARVYVVNQSPINSIGFTQALQLRYGRDDLSGVALTVSPSIGASTTDRVVRTGPDTIKIVRQDGVLFDSFIEQFHLFGEPVESLPEACRRADLELLHPPSSYEQLTTLEFRFRHSLDDPRTNLFVWDNQRIGGWTTLFRMAYRTELKRCEPLETAAAGPIQPRSDAAARCAAVTTRGLTPHPPGADT